MTVTLILIFVISAASLFLTKFLKKVYGILLSLVTLPFLIYFLSFFDTIREGRTVTESYPWFPGMNLEFSFYLDGLSLLFSILVLGIGSLILLYSNAYMKHHGYKGRFYCYLMLFMGSMLGLVISGNLITLYLFWSLTSFSSFLLIGFYSPQTGSRKAAIQALIVTETGGLAMLGGFILMGIVAGTHNIPEILSSGSLMQDHPWYTAILLLVLTGAFTKSAQFPFHFWLPAAMKAPTPVSAYLHSASMVKAGIFLLARLMPVLGKTELWSNLLISFGLFTLFTAVYISLTRRDIKSILAYTTISSLGMMVFLLGINTPLAFKAALLYLVAHALFKSSLFMVAGIIDEKTGTRDIYQTDRLWKGMKATAIIAILALLSMAGMPPLLGYIGKEYIYEAALHGRFGGFGIMGITVLSNAFMFLIAAILAYELFFNNRPGNTGKQEKAGIVFSAGAAILAVTGFILAIYPGKFEELLKLSIIASAEEDIKVDLKLWKGFSTVLLLSIITLGGGFIMFLFRNSLLKLFRKINKILLPVSFSEEFDRGWIGLQKISAKITVFIQHGYQRKYLLVIFTATAVLLWYLIFRSGTGLLDISTSGFSPAIAGIAILTCLSAIIVAFTNSKLAAIVTIGIAGYGVASMYFFYGAIDLAITQLLVETLTLVIFVMVVYKLPQFEKLSSGINRVRDGIVAILTGASITVVILMSGILDHKSVLNISEYLAENSYTEAHGRNIVNVILVDFRALDTLGEATVVLLAALGILSILTYNIKKKKS